MLETKEQAEHIEFQYIMNYKAYRRYMYMTRLAITFVVAAGLFCLWFVRMWLGIIFGTMAFFGGAFAIIAALHREETYIVFNTRFVLKHAEKRVSVPLENIKSVEYKRAFYEKKLATGTITITAKDPVKGKYKKYRMRHVFGARDGVAFLKNVAADNAKNDGKERTDGEDIG